MARDGVEIAGEVGEAEPGRGRLVAVATVLATLAAATTGYMQASALREHAEVAIRGERLAVLALNVAASNKDQAQVQLDRDRIHRQEQAQSTAAASAARRQPSRDARLESARWARIAAATARTTRAIARGQRLSSNCSVRTAVCTTRALPVIDGSSYSARNDPTFPVRYEESAQREGYRLSALREEANQHADAAEGRFAHLAAALTMLAVAVFLFGYSLTPQGRGRRALFSTVATAFALSGVAWAVYHGLRASGRPPASAAVAFASGQVALHEGDYELAIKQFRRATDLWPETVSAYVGLSAAEFAKNERDTTGILTLPRVASVRHAVADERKAIDNGSESPSVRSALAGNLLFLGLFTHDRASVREAGVLAREATQRFEEQLLEGRHPGSLLIAARYTIAEADFALGDPSYRGEYCAAIAQMVKLKDEVDPLVIANASWTDLGAIFTDHGSLLAAAKAIQQQVDAAAKTGRPTCSGILSG